MGTTATAITYGFDESLTGFCHGQSFDLCSTPAARFTHCRHAFPSFRDPTKPGSSEDCRHKQQVSIGDPVWSTANCTQATDRQSPQIKLPRCPSTQGVPCDQAAAPQKSHRRSSICTSSGLNPSRCIRCLQIVHSCECHGIEGSPLATIFPFKISPDHFFITGRLRRDKWATIKET